MQNFCKITKKSDYDTKNRKKTDAFRHRPAATRSARSYIVPISFLYRSYIKI